jgi:hypothetical protein
MIPDTQVDAHMTRLPNLVDGELQCERCGERERQGMPLCTQPDCPYNPQHEGEGNCFLAFAGTVSAVGLVFIALLLAIVSSNILSGILFFLVGFLFAIVIGIVGLGAHYGRLITLFNPHTGVMSRRWVLFGRDIWRKVIIPDKPLRFPSTPSMEHDAPMSAAMVRMTMQGLFSRRLQPHATYDTAARLIAATVADLAARDLLSVWAARAYKYNVSEAEARPEYVILPRDHDEPPSVNGRLEQRILDLVADWSMHLAEQRKNEGATAFSWWFDPRKRNEGATVFMLVGLILGKHSESPEKALMQVVVRDAVRYKDDTLLQEQAKQWYDQVAQMHSNFILEVERQAVRALKAWKFDPY